MMELKNTIEGMTSTDYKERFKAEYQQTEIRYTKLRNFCDKIEAYERFGVAENVPMHDCPLELLREQQRHMGEYLHILELRAIIEGIDLN